ncbi:hypothetical protein [Rhodanobacter sp. C06]|uniref:hypothetical protein n=1 Tax=Rhodanobacter sp. C06 TaxID=1945854 RepID=UPI0011156F72|nr:hypothetical protein [Rhodanobacter sp. C06]
MAPTVFVVEPPGKTSDISLRRGAIRVELVRGEGLQPRAMMLTLFPPARLWVCSECHPPLRERRPAYSKEIYFQATGVLAERLWAVFNTPIGMAAAVEIDRDKADPNVFTSAPVPCPAFP